MFENFEIKKELVPSDPRFGCGPSVIPVAHLEALAKTGKELIGTSHRQSAVKNLVGEVIVGFQNYFQLPKDYTVVLGNGGATFLFDMIGLGLVNQSSAHFTCGEFSQKWFQSHALIPWIKAEEKAVPFGQGVTPVDIPGFDVNCSTLNETSTGVQIDRLPKVGNDTLVVVDATSGGGQVPCNVSETDVYFFSPQKVFAGEGGLWFALMSPKAVERALKIEKDKTRYIPGIMKWSYAIDNSTKNQTYNTPSVANLFLVNEQLKVMNKVGYEGVVKEGARKAKLMYDWAETKPYLSCYIKEAKYRSTAVATIDVDDKIKVDDLLKRLRSLKAVYDIDGYRKLGRNQMRISMFPNVTYENLEKLTHLISSAIEAEL